jgi:hypothetical protein
MLVRFPRCGVKVRRDVVDDDVVRSGRVAHGIAARRRSEYAKPNFCATRHARRTDGLPGSRRLLSAPLRWTARGDRDITDD